MTRREALATLRDELSKQTCWEDYSGSHVPIRKAFDAGFTAALDLLWPCVEACQDISANKNKTLLQIPHSREYCSGANAGFISQAESSDEALATLDEQLKREGK